MNCEMPYAEVPPLFQMYDEESHAEFEIPAGNFLFNCFETNGRFCDRREQNFSFV